MWFIILPAADASPWDFFREAIYPKHCGDKFSKTFWPGLLCLKIIIRITLRFYNCYKRLKGLYGSYSRTEVSLQYLQSSAASDMHTNEKKVIRTSWFRQILSCPFVFVYFCFLVFLRLSVTSVLNFITAFSSTISPYYNYFPQNAVLAKISQ